MARKRTTEVDTGDDAEQITRWYRDRLAEPAVLPFGVLQPVCVGPTWQTTEDGHWLLPDATLGWDVLAWAGSWLQHSRGLPWRFTLEQARWILWWYALDERGRFLYQSFVLQRLKGWGKDPVGSVLAAVEAFGPCRFAGWDGDTPVSQDCAEAWVQVAAVSQEQTRNTMRLFPLIFTDEAKAEYGIAVGREMIHGLSDTRLIIAVTSSPATLEGGRVTFCLKNETHWWMTNNNGQEMAAVIERNASKAPGGSARHGAITNAYQQGQGSVAEDDRDAYDKMAEGLAPLTIFYDSLEAPPEAPLTAEAAPAVVEAIRGDSVWLDPETIVNSITDPRNLAARSRRWWYNQIASAEDAWLRREQWESRRKPERLLEPDEKVVLFFDGSKSDDATALVAAAMSDGHIVTVGVWQRPEDWIEKLHGKWLVPRTAVDGLARQFAKSYRVVAWFADPGTGEDDDGERYWDAIIDGWATDFGPKLILKATGGAHAHPVMWDMRGSRSERQRLFTAAVERTYSDIVDGTLTHDGNKTLSRHVLNARRRPNDFGTSIVKEHRESARKIDAAVSMVGAGMVRRLVLGSKEWQKLQRKVTGRGRVVVLS